MENRIIVDFSALDRIANKLNTASNDLDTAMSILAGAYPTKAGGAYLRLNGANISLKSVGGTVSAANVTQAVQNYRSAVKRLSSYSRSLSSAVRQASASFRSTEAGTGRGLSAGEKAPSASSGESKSLFGWKDLWKITGEFGIIGTLIGTIGEQITGGKTAWPKRLMQIGKGISKMGNSIFKGLSDAQVSSASFDWKRLIGFNTAITADTPTNFFLALKNEGLKYSFGNAKNVSGKVAVGCKWLGSIFTVGVVGYDNWTSEGDKNNSVGRKIGETAIESAVKIGGGMLISAGVTAGLAALGFVGAPAIAVGAATVGISLLINKAFEAATGKDFAENVSDFVFDTLPGVGKSIGNAIDKAGQAIGNAIDTAGKNIGDAVNHAGRSISGWWSGVTGGVRSAFGW